jgi:hypothetical protein
MRLLAGLPLSIAHLLTQLLGALIQAVSEGSDLCG